MTKTEAEKAIRPLCHTWFRTLSEKEQEHPSFGSFKSWIHANGYGGYLAFRSTMGADYDAEAWFDDELRQNWRR
ncbi:hypothetical protein [Rhizobium leucaenae]|uniref:hypothetical protein n=1 Tax=Rhizobium leucaenae TaxID=29450 RepID=UPI001609F915|nr:hypothetical protein [Rhizobium leucaenae]MBB6299408.1 hypothetical protein [Rhizobium leucaenae]